MQRIARGLLANEVIQRYHVNELAAPPFVAQDLTSCVERERAER